MRKINFTSLFLIRVGQYISKREKEREREYTMAKCFAYDFVCIIYNYPVFALASHVRFASLAFVKNIFKKSRSMQCNENRTNQQQQQKNGALKTKLIAKIRFYHQHCENCIIYNCSGYSVNQTRTSQLKFNQTENISFMSHKIWLAATKMAAKDRNETSVLVMKWKKNTAQFTKECIAEEYIRTYWMPVMASCNATTSIIKQHSLNSFEQQAFKTQFLPRWVLIESSQVT